MGGDHISYLGIEIGNNPASIAYWDPLKAKIQKKLHGWKANSVTLAGRVVLIKVALDSIYTHWLSIF